MVEDGIRAISPIHEMGVYEALWQLPGATRKSVLGMYGSLQDGGSVEGVTDAVADACAEKVLETLKSEGIAYWGVRVTDTFDYPRNLRDEEYPAPVLYYIGNWCLAYSHSVAVVGTRDPSEEGAARARKLAKLLVKDDYTVVSGLAKGIDTAALTAAIEAGGNTIAVIGTPITDYYPPENKALQQKIARDFLLVSHVPVLRYRSQGPDVNRYFFPERNSLMSAMSLATVIVEAGETSGTLVQARAALKQGRQLFILESCFHKGLAWPEKLLAKGAIRVKEYAELKEQLDAVAVKPSWAV